MNSNDWQHQAFRAQRTQVKARGMAIEAIGIPEQETTLIFHIKCSGSEYISLSAICNSKQGLLSAFPHAKARSCQLTEAVFIWLRTVIHKFI
jgi:hypothetical protein